MEGVTPKAWGSEDLLMNSGACAKRMVLCKGYRCSIHWHEYKDEAFHVIRGRMRVELWRVGWGRTAGEPVPVIVPQVFVLGPGETVRIPPACPHRFTGLEDTEFLEASTHDDAGDSHRLTQSGPVE